MPRASLPSVPISTSFFRAGERVCVAVSGGADSVALLLALHESNNDPRQPLGLVLTAAHVHHGLRGAEADADETFVRELCERLAVPLSVFHVDTAARQADHGETLEEAARELRYGALRTLLEAGTADTVVTAHTMDDQAETVLLKLLRGAWLEGLSAIAPAIPAGNVAPAGPGLTSGRIVRPLLRARRSEVEDFLRARLQVWRQDSTNADTELTRNRVRHKLMPALRGFNPKIDEALANLADLARDDHAFLAAETARLLPQLLLPGKPVRGGGRAVATAPGEAAVAFELDRLRAAAPALRRRLVRAAAAGVGCRLSFDETAKLLALAGIGNFPGISGKIGARLELRGGLRAERSARELRLWRQS